MPFTACLVSGLTDVVFRFWVGHGADPRFSHSSPQCYFAVAATAVVHFANNLFKLGVMARQAVQSAFDTLALQPLANHTKGCVRSAIRSGEREATIDELMTVV